MYLDIFIKFIKNHKVHLLPDGEFCFCVYLISVVESWMVQVMTDAGSQEDTQVTLRQRVLGKEKKDF